MHAYSRSLRQCSVSLCLLLWVFLVCPLVGCDITNTNIRPVPNLHNIIVYPNAQQIQSRQGTGLEQLPSQITTFTTSDAAEKVRAYYKETLLSQGWHYEQVQPYVDTLHFTYPLPKSQGRIIVYVVNVIITINSSAQTMVEIQVPDLP